MLLRGTLGSHLLAIALHEGVLLHGTVSSYPRDALQEGGAAVVACLPTSRGGAYVPPFSPSLLVDSTAFYVMIVFDYT